MDTYIHTPKGQGLWMEFLDLLRSKSESGLKIKVIFFEFPHESHGQGKKDGREDIRECEDRYAIPSVGHQNWHGQNPRWYKQDTLDQWSPTFLML